MAQLTKLSLAAMLCFLGAVGVAQVTPPGNARSGDQPVKLKCDGDSGEFHVKPKPDNPDTVTFTTRAGCTLVSFQFKQNAPGFKLMGTNPDGSISYKYDGTPIASTGYGFSYVTKGTKPTAGNGTGVIKN